MFAISVTDVALVYRWVLREYIAVLNSQISVDVALDQFRQIGYLYVTNKQVTLSLLVDIVFII